MAEITLVFKIQITLSGGYYGLILPSVAHPGYHDFWLFHNDYGLASYMFGCEVENDDEAIDLFMGSVYDYIPDFQEMMDNDE